MGQVYQSTHILSAIGISSGKRQLPPAVPPWERSAAAFLPPPGSCFELQK